MGRDRRGGVIWEISHGRWLGKDALGCYLPEKKKCLLRFNLVLVQGCSWCHSFTSSSLILSSTQAGPRLPPTGSVIIFHFFCLSPPLAVRGLRWERSGGLEVYSCQGKRLSKITTLTLLTSCVRVYSSLV